MKEKYSVSKPRLSKRRWPGIFHFNLDSSPVSVYLPCERPQPKNIDPVNRRNFCGDLSRKTSTMTQSTRHDISIKDQLKRKAIERAKNLSTPQTAKPKPLKPEPDKTLFDPSEYTAGKLPLQSGKLPKGEQPEWVKQKYG